MEFIQETNQTTLKCGHQYHASCYSENILSGNNHCALCRDEVCREIEQIPHISKTMNASNRYQNNFFKFKKIIFK